MFQNEHPGFLNKPDNFQLPDQGFPRHDTLKMQGMELVKLLRVSIASSTLFYENSSFSYT